ncbi:MAG: Fic family protein [Candidatus Peribacteraceae bacterium]|nr:Fic family protein [Candidatus Peribacteraceae bacterium]
MVNTPFRKIDDLQARINSFRPFGKELLAAWQERLRIDWTYNSNAIEGNTLTYGETAFFLREGLTSEGKPLKDYVEAKNHAEAIDYLHEVVRIKRRMTEHFIRGLHGLLLRGVTSTVSLGAKGKLIQKPLTAGAYKVRPNHVLTLSGTIHHYTEPLHVSDEMQSLLTWLRASTKLHPVERATLFHYRFVCIHPFDDGNGRMARLLMNLLLLQAGYPPCVVRSRRRKEYLQCLEHADVTGSTDRLLLFLAEELAQTQETMLAVLEGKSPSPVPEGTLNHSERQTLILNALDEKTLAIRELSSALPMIKRPTLKSDLQILRRTGRIGRKGKGKGAVYFRK